jgi:hypothetical protein
VSTSLVQLLCRTVKLAWFDSDAATSIVEDCKVGQREPCTHGVGQGGVGFKPMPVVGVGRRSAVRGGMGDWEGGGRPTCGVGLGQQ